MGYCVGMTYEEFAAKYNDLITDSLKYSLKQAGSGHFLEQAAKLDDAYPEFAARMMEEA